jgi:Protein of unknown function (DUF1189)
MSFLITLKDSLLSSGFYATMQERRTSALGFLFALSFLFAVAFTALSVEPVRKITDEIAALPAKALAMYPDSLVYSVSNGEATVMGVEEPLVIPFASRDFIDSPEVDVDMKEDGALVIDTKSAFSLDGMKAHNAVLWVAKDGVYSQKKNGEIRGFPYGKEANFVVSKTIVTSFFDVIVPYIVYILPALLFFIFLGLLFGFFVGYALFGLFIALLVKIYYSFILKNPVRFAHAYRSGVYAMAVPLVVYQALMHFSVYVFPFAFSIATLAVVVWNTYAHRKQVVDVGSLPIA